MRNLVLKYFEDHPEAKRAAEGKGAFLMREEFRASHHYSHQNGQTSCRVCGESFYAKPLSRCPGFAAKYPREDNSIERCILNEELLYEKTLRHCRALVLKRFSSPAEVTAQALVDLWHTHGCDSSIIEEVLDCRLDESIHAEFMSLMDLERRRSRDAQIKKVITVKGCA